MIRTITTLKRSRLPRVNIDINFHLEERRLFSATTTFKNGRILHHEWIVDGKVVNSNSQVSSTNANGEKLHTVIFLHGLLGNGKNLRSPAKRLTEHHPNLRALSFDLRGHGLSSINNDPTGNVSQSPHTIQNCALDIIETLKSLNLTGPTDSPVGIIGHSFGGRCALQYSHYLQKKNIQTETNTNIQPPRYTWLLDTVPGKAHSSVSNVIQALHNIDLSRIKTKQDLVEILISEEKIEKSIALWMTTNLKKVENRFEFMFDLDVAVGVLDDFPKQDFMQMVNECTSADLCSNRNYMDSYDDNDKVYLVMAGKNKAWTDEIVTEFKSLEESQKLELVTLPKAGHWVHVDDLDGLMDAMYSCFKSIKD